MWGFLIGLYIAVIIYPFIEEWLEKRANKSALEKMRRHSAMGHLWEPTKGQWIVAEHSRLRAASSCEPLRGAGQKTTPARGRAEVVRGSCRWAGSAQAVNVAKIA